MIKRDLRWQMVLKIGFLILLVIWCGVQIYAMHAQHRMEALILAVQKLRLNETDFLTAGKVMEKFGAQKSDRINSDGNHETIYAVLTPQGGLMKFGRSMELVIVLEFDNDNLLKSKGAFTSGAYDSCCLVRVSEVRQRPPSMESDFEVINNGPDRLLVNLTDKVDRKKQMAAWSIRMNCITSFAGCANVRDILPGVLLPDMAVK